jgi:hypothetical protein
MNDKLFKIEATLPGNPEPLIIYSAQKQQEEREKNIQLLERKLSQVFGINGDIADLGDKLTKTERNKSLSLYSASDSFWYQDNDLFASEDKKFSEALPDNRTAEEAALKFLRSNELLLPNADLHSVSYTSVAVSNMDSTTTDEYNTEVHVNLRYTLDNLPVFGPGAKTRVSFVDTNSNSGVYHFWREVKAIKKKRKALAPELALEIFSKNFRFSDLNDETAKVIIKDMQLGYYAMPPTDLQNFLIPVYKVTGTVITEVFPEYNFNHYIVAVKYSEADVKGMGVNIGRVKTLVF